MISVGVGLCLELLNQPSQLGGGFYQLLRRLLSVIGAARGALGCLRYPSDVAADLAASLGRFAHVARHLVRSRILFFDRSCDRARNVIDLVDYAADGPIASTAALVSV